MTEPDSEVTPLKGPVPRWKAGLVVFLILFAMGLRLVYAHGLPLNHDEKKHLSFAETLSANPDRLHLPLGNRISNHPVLTSYITAVSLWVAGGRIFWVRFVYVLISSIGLFGMFRLVQTLFGERAAVIALVLAGLDHHLLSGAAVFLEPVYLNLVPWILLCFHKAVDKEQRRQWLWVGALFGAGYQCSEIFLLLVPPLALYLLLRRRIVPLLGCRELYLGILVFFAIVSPHLVWNATHQRVNFLRHAERIQSFGIVPRSLLLYVGDLLINLKSSTWWVMGLAHKSYVPWNIPCHWTAGILYLVCLARSLRSLDDRGVLLLVCVIGFIMLFVSFLNAHEPWNEFGWASMTVFPMIALTARTGDRLARRRWGIPAGGVALFVLLLFAVVFLRGHKFGYASPFWEKAFLGKALHYRVTDGANAEEGRLLVEETLALRPNSVIVHYYSGVFASNEERKQSAFDEVLKRDPDNPLVHTVVAETELREGKVGDAERRLLALLEAGHDFPQVRKLLGLTELRLGNLDEAERHLKKSIRDKPDDRMAQFALFNILTAAGKHEEAVEAADRFAISSDKPGEAYLHIGRILEEKGDAVRSEFYLERARAMRQAGSRR